MFFFAKFPSFVSERLNQKIVLQENNLVVATVLAIFLFTDYLWLSVTLQVGRILFWSQYLYQMFLSISLETDWTVMDAVWWSKVKYSKRGSVGYKIDRKRWWATLTRTEGG